MLDDLRTYLQMATGITEATTAKARDAVSGLLATGMSLTAKAVPAPDVMGQVAELADDLVATSRNNRELLTGMIRAEVDKAVGRMGFVREDELAALRRHVQRLEAQIQAMEQSAERGATRVSVVEEAVVEEAVVEEAVADGPVTSDVPAPPRKKKILVDPEAGA